MEMAESSEMKTIRRYVFILIVLVLWTTGNAAESMADDWPQWRGPKADGLPVVKDIKKDWSNGLKKLWETNDLCHGTNSDTWAAPVIQGDRLVITGRNDDKDTVVCLNALTGENIWRKDYQAGHAQIQYGEGPRATPTISGDFVYTFGCLGHLACWKLSDGEQTWFQEIDKLGGERPNWGHSSSPLVWKDSVIVQGGGKILVAAFDKKTGKLLWSSGNGKAGYAAPILVSIDKKTQLLVFAGSGLLGLDPDNGTQLWMYAHPTAMAMNCATPVLVGESQLLLSSVSMKDQGGDELLNLTATGAKQVWMSHDVNVDNNDPVVVGNSIYAFSGYSLRDGELRCADLATGKLQWKTSACGGPGTVVCVDGQLLCLGNKGKMMLVKPSAEKFESVTEFQAIKGYPVWTVPVLVKNRMYVRCCSQLICYEIK